MPERPGSALATRPLHFILLADCSGSMAGEGKMPALNLAIREVLPHLGDIAASNPHARMLMRCVAFSTGARWHLGTPTPVDQVDWVDLACGGYTDLAAGLDLLTAALTVPPMEPRAMAPALVLVSDGMPTGDYRPALARLLEQPWGRASVRISVGIGRDADHDMLVDFMGEPDAEPLTAHNPEQLVKAIRYASVHVSKAASEVRESPATPQQWAPQLADEVSELTW